MKILNKTSIAIVTAVVLTSTFSCKKLLVEKPEAGLYPDYFSTAGGIQAGVTGVYNDLRGFYSGEPVDVMEGTDEGLYGSQQSSGALPLDTYNGLNSSNTPGFGNLWADINTLNGVIQYATASTSLDATTKGALIGEAKFLRGYIYYRLVTTYGGVTATQPSGIPLHTTFLTVASTTDTPAKESDIYNQIIQDFTDAAAGLPNTITSSNALAAFSNGGVGKTATAAVAQAYLAKTYLTRGYLESKQPTDFSQAATITQNLINNKATYGLDLWQDYNDAMNEVNDYGKENMFAIDYGIGTTDAAYSGYTLQGSGGYGLNELMVLWRWNYISNVGIDNVVGVDQVPQKIGGPAPMQRDVYNARPYGRIEPNPAYMQKIFNDANQIHDTRFDATFQTFWIANQGNAGPPVTAQVKAGKTSTGGLKPQLKSTSNFSQTSYNIPVDGDTAILMPNAAQSAATTMARRDAFPGIIVTQAQWSNAVFPTVKKFDETKRTYMNDFSGRPIVMLRFSEIYLMNAEANYMAGNASAAVISLNALRARAAYRVPADGNQIPAGQFRVTAANQVAMNTANAAANQLSGSEIALMSVPNVTTGTTQDACGMDVILDEYTREYMGEARRWFDLVRTQQLVRRVQIYNPNARANVKTYHMRRAIPQTLIDAVLTGPKYPQNNGY